MMHAQIYSPKIPYLKFFTMETPHSVSAKGALSGRGMYECGGLEKLSHFNIFLGKKLNSRGEKLLTCYRKNINSCNTEKLFPTKCLKVNLHATV